MATKIDPLAVVMMAITGLIALVLTIATLLIVVPGLGQTEPETLEVAVEAKPTRLPPTSLAVALTVVLPATTPTALPPTTTSASATLSPTEVIEAARSAAHGQARGTLQTGQELFEFRCAPCHGLKGEGLIGPAFNDKPALPSKIVLLRVRSGPAVMSAFPPEELSDEQVAAIAEYLQKAIVNTNIPSFTEADLEKGRELFKTYCAECHGVFGMGKLDTGPVLNQWPPLGINQIVKGGLLPLPDMPRLAITSDELVLVAGYIQSWAIKK